MLFRTGKMYRQSGLSALTFVLLRDQVLFFFVTFAAGVANLVSLAARPALCCADPSLCRSCSRNLARTGTLLCWPLSLSSWSPSLPTGSCSICDLFLYQQQTFLPPSCEKRVPLPDLGQIRICPTDPFKALFPSLPCRQSIILNIQTCLGKLQSGTASMSWKR